MAESWGEAGRAWVQLLAAFLGLSLLACLLPGPVTVAQTLLGRRDVLPTGSAASAVGETAMLLTASIVIWSLLVWALVVAGIAGLSRLPGTSGEAARQVLRRVAPLAARRALLTVVGASMVTGIAACGHTSASGPSTGGDVAVAGVSSGRLDGPGAGHLQWAAIDTVRPDGRAVVNPPSTAVLALAGEARGWIAVEGSAVHLQAIAYQGAVDTPAPPSPDPITVDWPTAGTDAAQSVVVLRGDSLWSIAARHLPAHAGPADIERAWHQWYAANTAVIGSDPNLILPGQILQPPHSGTGDRS